MTIKEILNWAGNELAKKNIASAPLDAEVLLMYALSLRAPMGIVAKQSQGTAASRQGRVRGDKRDRVWLLVNQNYQLLDKERKIYRSFIRRREKGEPVAYITGEKEFFGLNFYVNDKVLIPRPETELLVEEALAILKAKSYKLKVLDLGTGSGCIIIAIVQSIYCSSNPDLASGESITINLTSRFVAPLLSQRIKLYASDISIKALNIAKRNANLHKVLSKIRFRQGDLFEPWKDKKFDLIIANLPYLKKEELLPYEPKKALHGGKSGMEIYKNFLRQVGKHLNKNGVVLIEINPDQKPALVKEINKQFNSPKIKILKDLSGKKRVLKIVVPHGLTPVAPFQTGTNPAPKAQLRKLHSSPHLRVGLSGAGVKI